MKTFVVSIAALFVWTACEDGNQSIIDREALVERNSPVVMTPDSLVLLPIGDGESVYAVGIAGLQTFPGSYKKEVPLGTQSQQGWHGFANPGRSTPEETLKGYDFGRGKKELYATQFKEGDRQQDVVNWFHVNPHHPHLGIVGFDVEEGTDTEQATDVHQELCLWDGKIKSRFKLGDEDYQVETVCHPSNDMITANITSKAHTGICLRFPYSAGAHCDNTCNREAVGKHITIIVTQDESSAVLEHTLDSTRYFVALYQEGKVTFSEKAKHYLVLTPMDDHLAFTYAFASTAPSTQPVTIA